MSDRRTEWRSGWACEDGCRVWLPGYDLSSVCRRCGADLRTAAAEFELVYDPPRWMFWRWRKWRRTGKVRDDLRR